jgi:hypothetical protein
MSVPGKGATCVSQEGRGCLFAFCVVSSQAMQVRMKFLIFPKKAAVPNRHLSWESFVGKPSVVSLSAFCNIITGNY